MQEKTISDKTRQNNTKIRPDKTVYGNRIQDIRKQYTTR